MPYLTFIKIQVNISIISPHLSVVFLRHTDVTAVFMLKYEVIYVTIVYIDPGC